MEDQVNHHSNIDRIKYSNWIYTQKIPEEICELIIRDFKNEDYKYGPVGKDRRIDFSTRKVKSTTIPLDHWCLGILLYFGLDANIANFKYNIDNLAFTEFFTYEEGMFYKPHIDISDRVNEPTHCRKLTIVLQLSNPEDYDGGDLIIYSSNLKPQKMPRERGTIVVFDSRITHSVSKVTRGIRHSLCGWMVGMPFS